LKYKKKMKVNFNNLRKQAVLEMQELSKQLNAGIVKDSQWAKPNDVYHNQQIDIKGYVLVDAEEIEHSVNCLLSLINSIACVCEEGNEDFKDMTSEIEKTLSGLINKILERIILLTKKNK